MPPRQALQVRHVYLFRNDPLAMPRFNAIKTSLVLCHNFTTNLRSFLKTSLIWCHILTFLKMDQSRPLCPFLISIKLQFQFKQYKLKKAQLVCLGFEPRATERQVGVPRQNNGAMAVTSLHSQTSANVMIIVYTTSSFNV